MRITTILFDLDGTLLPMDQEAFVKAYFDTIAKKMEPFGYDPEQLIRAIGAGVGASIKNDGSRTNEIAFWETYAAILGDRVYADRPLIDDYYRQVFPSLRPCCGYLPETAILIRRVKELGLRTVLATNPIFPSVATENRIRWAGLEPSDFELYTTHENSHFCKPNPAYYQEILTKLSLTPAECLMVGNDVTEDMVAQTLGIQVFLLTHSLINRDNIDISRYPHGDFQQLTAYIESLC